MPYAAGRAIVSFDSGVAVGTFRLTKEAIDLGEVTIPAGTSGGNTSSTDQWAAGAADGGCALYVPVPSGLSVNGTFSQTAARGGVMVWFGQLDIPAEVVQAHRDGDLVVFVGAGASAGAPSSLPLFGGLAAQIAAETGIAMGESEPFDVYLGRADESANVHARVAEIIGNPTSRPNGTHEAIAALARTAGACRIVSTNYDRHVSAALAGRGRRG